MSEKRAKAGWETGPAAASAEPSAPYTLPSSDAASPSPAPADSAFRVLAFGVQGFKFRVSGVGVRVFRFSFYGFRFRFSVLV